MSLPSLDLAFLRETLDSLLLTPSPVGFTSRGTELCRQFICEFAPAHVKITPKGALVAEFAGENDDAPRCVCAHIDTLGAMVKAIKPNGKLQLAQLGNTSWNSLENESATLFLSDGRELRGSIVVENPSHHLYTSGDGNAEIERSQKTMELRIDARIASAGDANKLGIQVGDVVALDPRPEWNDGFVRSRYLDDKALLACLFTAHKALFDAQLKPKQRTTLLIANYEEVGHGGSSGFPRDTKEFLALDVAVVGLEQNSSEFGVSICALDSRGPYDYDLRRRLEQLARENEIPACTDVFTEYSSDVCAFREAGGDARVALIGPGVDGTHGIERTHLDALEATTNLLLAYLLN